MIPRRKGTPQIGRLEGGMSARVAAEAQCEHERPMSYVPRNPRRVTKLRAVLDDGRSGPVRNMSTSGLLVDTLESRSSALTVGRRIAVVPLVGDLDGERLPAEVARVA